MHGGDVPQGVRRRRGVGAHGHRGHGVFGGRPHVYPQGPHGRPGGHVRRAGAGEGALTLARRSVRRAPWVVLVALVLGGTAAAQAVPAPRDTTRPDTTRRDTTTRVDTARAKPDTAQHAVPMPSDTTHSDTTGDTTQVPKDTIKAPLAHAEMPQLVGIGSPYHWDRDQMFASGAINLLDLLKLIPGVTAFRSGWITSPQYAAYLGNPARVR